MFDGEQGAGGAESTETTTDTTARNAEPGAQDGGSEKVEFTAEQQREMGRILARERKAAADKARADAKAEADAVADQARKDKAAEDAKKAGDFEKVESTLKTDLQAAKDAQSALQAQVDQYQAAVDAVLKADWDALADDVKEFYPGDEDDTLAKVNWLPKGKALHAKLHPEKTDPKAAHGRDPKATGAAKPTNEAASKAQAAIYRNFCPLGGHGMELNDGE